MIVITGASDGLGAAIVDEAGRLGQETFNISRRPNSKATINLAADLSTLDGIALAASKIKETKNVDAIVLNAGVLSIHPFPDMSDAEYERVMAINLRAPTLLLGQLFECLSGSKSMKSILSS